MSKGEYRISVPNILSVFRLLLIPLFIMFFFSDIPNNTYIAAGVWLLSGITDVADGFIARKFNMITNLGKILDPLADKLTQAAVCGSLMLKYPVVIPLFVIFFIKELLMAIGGILILKSGRKIASSKWFGKASTTILFIVMMILIIVPEGVIPVEYVSALIAVAISALVFSLLMYIPEFLQIYKNQ